MLGLTLKAITSIGFWHFVFKTTLLAAGIGALGWLFLWSLSLSGYVPVLLIALASWIFAAPPQAAYQLYHWVFRKTPAADIPDPNDFPALDLSDDAQRDDALKYYDYCRKRWNCVASTRLANSLLSNPAALIPLIRRTPA